MSVFGRAALEEETFAVDGWRNADCSGRQDGKMRI